MNTIRIRGCTEHLNRNIIGTPVGHYKGIPVVAGAAAAFGNCSSRRCIFPPYLAINKHHEPTYISISVSVGRYGTRMSLRPKIDFNLICEHFSAATRKNSIATDTILNSDSDWETGCLRMGKCPLLSHLSL